MLQKKLQPKPKSLLKLSLKSSFSGKYIEAGLDEVGRGCLAGPVVAAAVILPLKYKHSYLNDSKQLTATQRKKFCEDIKKDALAWAISEVSHQEIDKINILNASILAMHQALDEIFANPDVPKPELLLVDGNRFKPYINSVSFSSQFIPYQCIIKGDTKFLSIAAASILAKTYRDELMQELGLQYPEYGWDKNAGYPTQKHRTAILEYGFTPFHRLTFRVKA
jgi:ribonuclease HII